MQSIAVGWSECEGGLNIILGTHGVVLRSMYIKIIENRDKIIVHNHSTFADIYLKI